MNYGTWRHHDTSTSAIGRLLLPAFDFGTVSPTCWRPVCLVTYNISLEAENSYLFRQSYPDIVL